MKQEWILIFLIALSLFTMQAVGGYFQIKDYKKQSAVYTGLEMSELDRKRADSFPVIWCSLPVMPMESLLRLK